VSRHGHSAWTADKLREQGLTTTVEVAAEVLRISRGAAYDAIRRDMFPVPVIKLSRRRWVVPTAHLLRVLGVDEDGGT
jgi:hypothetical protein